MKYKDSLCVNADGSAVDLTPQVGDLVELPSFERLVIDESVNVGQWEYPPHNGFLEWAEYDSLRYAKSSDCTLVSREGCKPKESRLTNSELLELLKDYKCDNQNEHQTVQEILEGFGYE